MIKESDKRKIEQIDNLPTLPEIASRLMSIINNPNTTAAEVAALISRDLSLTSKILRLANSAFYGIPRTVTTVNNAVVILGLKVINTMVFSLSVVRLFPADGGSASFSRRKFWDHGLACAAIAKLLAQRMHRFTLFDPEECFCSGLIHDIGRIVLDQYFHEQFLQVLDKARTSSLPLVEAEKAVLGFDHGQVGEWLTAKWELPQDLRLPIIHHHAPGAGDSAQEITTLVHLADQLCYELGYILPGFESKPALDLKSVQQLGFTAEDLREVKEKAPAEIERCQAAFSG